MQLAAQIATVTAGVILIALTLNDVFQSVIVPRAGGRGLRPSTYQWRAAWRLWPELSWRLFPRNGEKRENFLAVYAPFSLVNMLVAWVVLLVLGYGAIFWALKDQLRPIPISYWEACYFAGSAFFTIGFGDIVGRTGITRLLSLMAGASGLGVVSVTTAYLFALFGSFQVREAFVVTAGARAGSPPSGVGLLVISKVASIDDDLGNVMRDGQLWAARVMESHLAYPTLAYFRSSHDYESWVGTLGMLLDAAVLLISAIEGATGQANIMYALGRHATRDLSHHFRTPGIVDGGPGITRAEFDAACEQLERAGYTLKDRDGAWETFASLRESYAANLAALARFFAIPAIQWVGDRSLISLPHESSKTVNGVALMEKALRVVDGERKSD